MIEACCIRVFGYHCPINLVKRSHFMCFAAFLAGAFLGGVVAYVWRDDLAELWDTVFRRDV